MTLAVGYRAATFRCVRPASTPSSRQLRALKIRQRKLTCRFWACAKNASPCPGALSPQPSLPHRVQARRREPAPFEPRPSGHQRAPLLHSRGAVCKQTWHDTADRVALALSPMPAPGSRGAAAIVLVVLLLAHQLRAQRDPYEVLGIKSSAKAKDIKKAFHKLALQYHPDKVRGRGSRPVPAGNTGVGRVYDAQ